MPEFIDGTGQINFELMKSPERFIEALRGILGE